MNAPLSLRITALIPAIVFVWMAYLQLDDADAPLWIAVYGVAAVLALLTLFALPIRIALIALAIGCTIWSLSLADGVPRWLNNHSFDFIFDDESTKLDYMEYSRESLGLALVVIGALWLLVVDAFNRR